MDNEDTYKLGTNGTQEEIQQRILPLCTEIDKLISIKQEKIIIAIEGRCASGKTTTANLLAKMYDCNLFHMDDFFLRPEQRTKERLEKPGENVDHERFLVEVLTPLSEGEKVNYRKYNCGTHSFERPIIMLPKRINIIEGVYSMHPTLFDYYDLTVFLSVTEPEQRKRIIQRNTKEMAEIFFNTWIPLEEMYYSNLHIQSKAELII